MKISIVIPTIGNRNLTNTLNSIYQSSLKAEEVILSIPHDTCLDKNKFNHFKNLKIIKSLVKGQVVQRIEGFKVAQNDVVVQLDDDIILEKKCIELMHNFITKNNNVSVSAHFHDIISKKSIYLNEANQSFSNHFFLSELNNFKNKLINKIYNKIKSGNKRSTNGDISISGFETYPSFKDFNKPFISEWIPGGCVMHLKKNLVLSNFFPYTGKAYCEDLFHSIALKKNNIKLYYHTNAKAFLEIEDIKSSFKMYIKHLRADLQIRKKLVEQNKLSKSRMYFVYIIKTISYLFR